MSPTDLCPGLFALPFNTSPQCLTFPKQPASALPRLATGLVFFLIEIIPTASYSDNSISSPFFNILLMCGGSVFFLRFILWVGHPVCPSHLSWCQCRFIYLDACQLLTCLFSASLAFPGSFLLALSYLRLQILLHSSRFSLLPVYSKTRLQLDLSDFFFIVVALAWHQDCYSTNSISHPCTHDRLLLRLFLHPSPLSK